MVGSTTRRCRLAARIVARGEDEKRELHLAANKGWRISS